MAECLRIHSGHLVAPKACQSMLTAGKVKIRRSEWIGVISLRALDLAQFQNYWVFYRSKNDAVAEVYSKATKGLPPLKITNVKAILTAPAGIRFAW